MNLIKSVIKSVKQRMKTRDETSDYICKTTSVDGSIFALAVQQPYLKDQLEVAAKVDMLRRAAMHINSAELNQMLTNLEVLSFGIGWFGLVSDACFSANLLSNLCNL
jgi:hypothetical protein